MRMVNYRSQEHLIIILLIIIIIQTTTTTSGEKNNIRPHCRRTRTVQSYSLGGASVHPHVVHPNRLLHCTSSAPSYSLWVYQLLDSAGPVLPSKLSLRAWTSGPPSNAWFLEPTTTSPPESTSQAASWSVQPFLQGSQSWQTDRLCCCVCNNRPHLATAVMRPKMCFGWCLNLWLVWENLVSGGSTFHSKITKGSFPTFVENRGWSRS